MCGIAGIARASYRPIDAAVLLRMAAAIRHRGPDGYGVLADRRIGLAHVRLSIIDLVTGDQPMGNEDGTLWTVFNGEIYNWVELREQLEARGHAFRTRCDSEVLLHGYEEWGTELLDRLEGQFAFAIYDRRDDSLLLARDRFGVRPLFYAMSGGDLYFASEAKALFASGEITAAPDPQGLDQVFTWWSPRAPRTVFRGVHQLQPGTFAHWRRGDLALRTWWTPTYQEADEEPEGATAMLDQLLRSAVGMRMRADVPVGAYLSGGLDSSVIASLAAACTPHTLRTFSITFADPALDESAHQLAVARGIGSDHAIQLIDGDAIARVFPDVVRHTETPLLRTSPAPMYLLAKLARERGITVVLTGEGSDELFLGYDLFREAEIRRFCLRQPSSSRRPRLFDRLYPYLRQGAGGEVWRRFFLEAGPPDDPLFSHQPRIRLASFVREFYGEAMRSERPEPEAGLRRALPAGFESWSHTAQAAWLEITTLLEGYLLSSQSDRVAMAHGVEARYPFLDSRLFAFAASLPERSKLRGLHEKDILRRWAAGHLPAEVAARPKQPYRAPDVSAFFGRGAGAPWVRELLGEAAVRRTGLFDPHAVAGLAARCAVGRAAGVREGQALVGILSAQLWYHTFFIDRQLPGALALDGARVRRGELLESSTSVLEDA